MSRRVFLVPSVLALAGQPQKSKMFGDAEAYERFMGRWSRLVAPRLADFTDVPEQGRVLDVGSGTGSLAFAIAQRKPASHVVGIDPSKEYVAYAQSKNTFPTRATFEVGDAQTLHFANASFDAAASLLVFNFIPDPKKALMEVQRVTKPHGKVSAAVWDYGDGMRMLRTFWDAAVSLNSDVGKRDEKHMKLCRTGQLSDLWKQCGLEKIREQAIDVTMRFKSFADYWDPFLLGQGPAGAYTATLAGDALQKLRTDVKRRLSLKSEDAPFELLARVWAVRGEVPA